MKKLLSILILAALVLSLCACGGEKTEAAASEASAAGAPMLDLTAMSSTIMFAELFNMTMTPDDYVGRTVKMKGQFSVFVNPNTGKDDFGILVVDATACCTQGLDLALAERYAYPEEYPAVDQEITVVGTYEKYTENGMTRFHIGNATWE